MSLRLKSQSKSCTTTKQNKAHKAKLLQKKKNVAKKRCTVATQINQQREFSKRVPLKKGHNLMNATPKLNTLDEMKSELNEIATDNIDFIARDGDLDDAEKDNDDITRIFGGTHKLVLPEIPVNGKQCYWGLAEDPYNPFVFPVLHMAPILAPTDISVNIDSKDSDLTSDELYKNYQTMVNSTIQQGGQVPHPDSSVTDKGQLELSLKAIGSPTQARNPLELAGAQQKLLNNRESGTTQLNMATSKIKFDKTIIFHIPIRKSGLTQIQKVFQIVPDAKQNQLETKATISSLTTSNELSSELITLAKASETNKRFDIYLTRGKNEDDKKSLNTPFDMDEDESNNNQQEKEHTGPMLIFSSNVTTHSLEKTKTRLATEQREMHAKALASGRNYEMPLQEHVCIERNYLLELQRRPVLVEFSPEMERKMHPSDPITHILIFPVVGSVTTYSTTDPLGSPPTEATFRMAEAEFLIKSCLMGLNMPAPIDPAFDQLIRQDRAGDLSAEESQKAREVIARSLVAIYGHGSGLAAEPWSISKCMVKEEVFKSEDAINFEVDITYSHQKKYDSLYALHLLPTKEEVEAQLAAAQKQYSQFTSEMGDNLTQEHLAGLGLDKIRSEVDSVLGEKVIEEIMKGGSGDVEDEVQKRLAQLEDQQRLFHQKMEETMRVARVAGERKREYQEAQGAGDQNDDQEYELPEFIEAEIVNDDDHDETNLK